MEASAAGSNLAIFRSHFAENYKHGPRLEREVAGQGTLGEGVYEGSLANCFYIWDGVEQHQGFIAD